MYQKPKPIKRKSPIKYIVVVLVAFAVGIGVYFVMSRKSTDVPYKDSNKQLSSRESPATQKPTRTEVDAHAADPQTPVRIYMSRIGIVARLIPVDAVNGFPTFTANIHDAGWDKASSSPSSDKGIILISGYESFNNSDGAFVKIKDLNVGDGILIEQGNGTKTSFNVTLKKEVSSDEAAEKTLRANAPTNEVELRLVTNAGGIVTTKNGYQTRTIIIAKKQG